MSSDSITKKFIQSRITILTQIIKQQKLKSDNIQIKQLSQNDKYIEKKFNRLKNSQFDGIVVSKVGVYLRHWQALVSGPIGSPYENGLFTVDIKFPKQYPLIPPKV